MWGHKSRATVHNIESGSIEANLPKQSSESQDQGCLRLTARVKRRP